MPLSKIKFTFFYDKQKKYVYKGEKKETKQNKVELRLQCLFSINY